MGSATSTSSSSKSIQTERRANTQKLMEGVMTGGEISKKREAELQKAANYGRGVKFVEAKPYVGGDNVFRIDPATGEKKRVMRTGTTAADFTGSIIANKPTTGELMGDIGRGLFGGQAKDPEYLRSGTTSAPGTTTTDYMKYTPKPEKVTGLIPAVIDASLKGNLSPIGLVIKGVQKSGFFSYGDGKDAGTNQTTQQTEMNTTNDIADNDRKMRLEKRLALSKAGASSDKSRPFLTIKSRGFGGTMN